MGRYTPTIDWVAAIILLCLGSLGLFLQLTISNTLFTAQFLYLLLGFIFMVLLSFVDIAILWLLGPVFFIIANIFLLISYFGPVIRGATRWIVIGSAQLQPSELVKPLLLVAYARLISQYSPRHVRYIPFHLLLFLIPFVLIFRQPDLGTSIVYACFWLAMMVAGGLPLKALLGTTFAIGTLSPIIWRILATYQKARILTFIDPLIDPRGAGYNAIQAMIAVGSGQLFGRGLGLGTQSHLRFLPEFHTDFIFATLVEELGFVGGMFLLFGYASLLWRILRPLLRGTITDSFPYIYSIGLFATILAQLFINAGMNMGIIPITGITMPFVSYGGSSILSLSFSFGMLWALQRENDRFESIAIR